MTVVTDANTYLFDLVASPKARPLYVLRFTYPEVIEPAPQAADPQFADAAPSAIERQAATDPYAVADPAQLNFAWEKSGDPSLLPEQAFDDGDATFLTWSADREIPAIQVLNDKGVEGPVNYAVRDDTIVVDGVPERLILRRGKLSAELINTGPRRQTALAVRENK
jgi:type IV secretion system protein VirB9